MATTSVEIEVLTGITLLVGVEVKDVTLAVLVGIIDQILLSVVVLENHGHVDFPRRLRMKWLVKLEAIIFRSSQSHRRRLEPSGIVN